MVFVIDLGWHGAVLGFDPAYQPSVVKAMSGKGGGWLLECSSEDMAVTDDSSLTVPKKSIRTLEEPPLAQESEISQIMGFQTMNQTTGGFGSVFLPFKN